MKSSAKGFHGFEATGPTVPASRLIRRPRLSGKCCDVSKIVLGLVVVLVLRKPTAERANLGGERAGITQSHNRLTQHFFRTAAARPSNPRRRAQATRASPYRARRLSGHRWQLACTGHRLAPGPRQAGSTSISRGNCRSAACARRQGQRRLPQAGPANPARASPAHRLTFGQPGSVRRDQRRRSPKP